jgi:hypothetical protein
MAFDTQRGVERWHQRKARFVLAYQDTLPGLGFFSSPLAPLSPPLGAAGRRADTGTSGDKAESAGADKNRASPYV